MTSKRESREACIDPLRAATGRSPTYVTQPYLPPLAEFLPYLEEIWRTKTLTNCGPFHEKLESSLAKFLDVEHIALCANGTLALVVALQALRIAGEVITTPFSFVATSHSLLWNFAKPIFVDIDPVSLNLNPAKIEAAITPNTTAILPVHCYGRPCDSEQIDAIADIYNLRVIYDAAHAFGVKDNEGSILRHGDLSVLSFHATKVFNTFEGGAIVCHDAKMKARIDRLKNFGHAGETTVVAPGINGKMSEFNAALGLLQLDHIKDVIAARKRIDEIYRARLRDVEGITILPLVDGSVPNFSYFPILVEKSFPCTRDDLCSRLKERGINPRRYFFPLISEYPMYSSLPSARGDRLPVAVEVSRKVMCLPIYPTLPDEEACYICDMILGQA